MPKKKTAEKVKEEVVTNVTTESGNIDVQELKSILIKPIDKDLIEFIPGPRGTEMPYIPKHVVVKKANEIFGPLGWDISINEPTFKEFAGKKYDPQKKGYIDTTYITVMMLVTVSIHHGSYSSSSSLGVNTVSIDQFLAATDGVIQKAFARGLKKALTKFGPAFGLGIVDILNEEETPVVSADQVTAVFGESKELSKDELIKKISGAENLSELQSIVTVIQHMKESGEIKGKYTEPEMEEIRNAIREKSKTIS
jgi:recombination DNA repair RAD52 pathway protein